MGQWHRAWARVRAGEREEGSSFGYPCSHHLYQHRAALPAADTFGGDAAPRAQSLHGIDEVQHDTVAAAAHGMAEADRAATDVPRGLVEFAGGAVEAKNLLAEFLIVPGGKTAQHLRRKR